jgi:hypothetical protein
MYMLCIYNRNNNKYLEKKKGGFIYKYIIIKDCPRVSDQ